MIKLYTIATLAVCGIAIMPATSRAQYKEDYARTASVFYANHDYYSSAKYYELFLDSSGSVKSRKQNPYVIQKQGIKTEHGSKNKMQAAWRLAESYRQLNDYTHAEKWYGTVAAGNSNQLPLAPYWYGICLRANGKYTEAEKSLLYFIKSYGTTDNYLQSARKELLNLAFIKEQLRKKDTVSYKIAKLTGDMNTPGFANYAPAISNNTVYFTSTRRDTMAPAGNTPYYNNLYRFTKDSVQAHTAGVPVAAGWEQGAAGTTADGTVMYLTRWQKNVAQQNVTSIYKSIRNNDGSWSQPQADSTLNLPGYNSQQPNVTADGRYLLFASDRPGGAGGFDIWYAPLATHGQPVNAGPQINTPGNEHAPYYHTATATLVFATDNRTGMGGFDLYSSQGNISIGRWEQPVNMGYPLNSAKDDIYFVSGNTDTLLQNAYISSDRASACCLELFAVSVPQPTAVTVPPAAPPVIVTATPADAPETEPVTTGKEQQVIVYFDFDKSELLPQATALLDTLARQLTKAGTLVIEIAGYTDGKGTEAYNLALSRQRATACFVYLSTQKHIDTRRLIIKAYGECCPVEKELTENGKDNPAGRQRNRRVEFKIAGVQ